VCPGRTSSQNSPAVVDDARDDRDVVARGGVERELAGPRLERVEDEHRPVDQVPEALEAADDVEREAVRRPRGDADPPGEALGAHLRERVPHDWGSEPGAVGVVEQQHVEGVDAAARKRALDRHADVVAIALGAAQPRIREPREALRALAFALVEVVADRAHERVLAPRHPRERPAEQRVGLARAVRVGGQHGGDPVAGPQQRQQALLPQRLAVVHEVPAAPGPDGGVGQGAHRDIVGAV
jgi:hypothetical protein